MGVFEILFIALFILLPILEQVQKRRRKSGEGPGPEAGPEGPGPDAMETRPGEVSPRSSERQPVKAADMVPDDLWAVLTGEERSKEGVRVEEHESTAERAAEPAAAEPAAEPAAGEPAAEPSPGERPARWEEAWTPRAEPRWRMDDLEETPAPASLEHQGPEAYSLETFEREAVSLETPLASPEARHRRFHETIDRPPPPRRPPRSPIGRALQSPASLRQAFVLSEVLGPPKGLE